MRRECVFFLIALTVQFSSAQLDLSFIDPFYYLYNLQNNNNFNNIHNFNLNNNNNNNNNDFLDFNQQPLTGCIANSNNLQGTCMQGHECKYSRGTNTGRGNCTFLNSCCTYTKSCNDTVRARVVYFRNPANPRSGPSPCTLRLQLLNEDICQIRVDVMQIDLEGMVVDAVPPTPSPFVCSEYVTVDPMPTESIPRICGDRMNNHFYIHLNRNLYNNFININVILQQLSTNLASSGTWNMRLTQLECPGRKNKKTAVNHKKRNENQAADDLGELAPAGCTQYNTQLTGVVQSFGNTVATGANALPPSRIADNYAVCFKRFPNTCGVMFTISAPTMAVCDDMLLELNIPLPIETVTPCTPTGMASFTMYHPGPLYINYMTATTTAAFNNVLLNYALTSTCLPT